MTNDIFPTIKLVKLRDLFAFRLRTLHFHKIFLSYFDSQIFLLSEFATLIKSEVGSNSNIVHKAAVEDDPQRRRPDISLAKKVLHWQPKVTLKQGLAKTIEYFRKELSRKHYSDGMGTHPDEYRVNEL